MVNNKTVKQWFTYAARDLRLAKQSLELSNEYKNVSAFLSQQAAEKAIKGFLACNKVRVQKTHDLKALATDVAPLDDDLAKLIRKHESMSKFAVAYRYPNESQRPLSLARAKSAVKNARTIYDECFARVYGGIET